MAKPRAASGTLRLQRGIFTIQKCHFLTAQVPLSEARQAASIQHRRVAHPCLSRLTETLLPLQMPDGSYFRAKSLAVACFFTTFAPRKDVLCGNSSVGRAQPCQGWGRGFKSRLPLQRRRNGGIGRHEGLKIPWPVMAVRVRVPLAARLYSFYKVFLGSGHLFSDNVHFFLFHQHAMHDSTTRNA